MDRDAWGVRADASTGSGYLAQSRVSGVVLMPYYDVTDKLQVVARYTHISSAEPNGVRLALYENRVVAGRGDNYDEGYIGANYLFYGHKLKLQTGVQFGDMADRANDGGAYSGTSWTSGVRVGWP
jgi:phosphate-selective porin OprO/OprP